MGFCQFNNYVYIITRNNIGLMKYIMYWVVVLCSVSAMKLAASLDISGKWQQGELLIGKTVVGSRVLFQDKPITIGEDGLFILGLHRDEPQTATITIYAPGRKAAKRYAYSVAQRQYPMQHVTGVKKDYIKPSKQQLDRAIKENRQIKKARRQSSYRRDFLNQYMKPVQGITTGVYGSQRSYNGVLGRPHFGWDIAAKTGTPVLAPNSGVVIYAKLDTFYSGSLIIIDHGFDLNSSFLHLSAIDVTVGDEIKRGQKIGAVGASGRVTGPHLDWRMNWGSSRIDPQSLCNC